MKKMWGWGRTGLAVLMVAAAAGAAEPAVPVPDFALSRRGTNEVVQLADLRGQVVVLDFFAHWCVPCVRCSTELEQGIRQHYTAQKGNAKGVPVAVFAVNVESAQPQRTEAFIQRAGLKDVLDDPQGELFAKLGGSGMPYVVVIDATGGQKGDAPPSIIYLKAGWEGVPRLREVIDQVGGPMPPAAETIAANQPAEPKAVSPVLHKAGADLALMRASDVLLFDAVEEYRQTWPRTELSLSLSQGYIHLDYVPESLLQEETNVDADRFGFQASGRYKAQETLTLTTGGGAYYGFMDYRSLWLDEHFKQLYSRRVGYDKAHPWGYNVSAGARWEYLPASGFLQADFSFLHDVISPGYEVRLMPFPPTLIRFRDRYDTFTGQLTFENVLSARVRALQEIRFTSTTDRQMRYSLQSSLNVAIAEHWVGRVALSGTKEDPQFESWFVGATLERDWNQRWFVSLIGRYYEDTGQIENALLAENTAAPAVQAFQLGLGLRWQGVKSSFKLLAGPYFNHYDPPNAQQASFGHLYSSRDWFWAQFAFAHEF